MPRKKTFSKPPLSPMNQWARDAYRFAEGEDRDITYDQAADALNRAQLGTTYDKTIAQKMTTDRKISLEEAAVLSRITRYPLPEGQVVAMTLDERVDRLSPRRRQRILEDVDDAEAAEAIDRLNGLIDPASPEKGA